MVSLKHYNRLGGLWNIPDDIIEGLFIRMKDEGKDSFSFPGDGEPETSEQFRKVFQFGIESLYLVYTDDGEVMGFVWLNRFEHKLARIHFCSFDGFGLDEKIGAAEYVSDYVLGLKDGDGYIFDVLEGRIASGNRAAQMLVSAAGFIKTGFVPHGSFSMAKGISEDAVIYCKTRKTTNNNSKQVIYKKR